jgi:ankyrin repeat protein
MYASLILDDAQLVTWYLEHGADPNARCGLGSTPFSVAVQEHSLATIKLLRSHGADPRIGNPLHYAVLRKCDRVEVLEWLLAQGACVDKLQDRTSEYHVFIDVPGMNTPLAQAASCGFEDSVEVLCDTARIPISSTAKAGLPIDLAARRGHWRVADLLQPLSLGPIIIPEDLWITVDRESLLLVRSAADLSGMRAQNKEG